MTEHDAMRRALELAWGGWGRVHPNPLVGAVVLAGDAVVGEGFHAEYGGPHAEAEALAAAGERARGATLVVTLEPCHHRGKQPPCSDLVRRAGVARVVAAMGDPNPVAAGGAAALEAAGIQVVVGIMEEEARAQNATFLHRFSGLERPYIALKLATSIDGRIADHAGHSRWISGEEARDYVHWLRAGFDAIGVGEHTARVDDASLTVRGSVVPRVEPKRVIFGSQLGELLPTVQLVRTASELPTILLADPRAPSSRIAALAQHGVIVQRAGTLAERVGLLRSDGIESLLVEGGGRLAGALLAAGLVDRFYWIQSPVWIGERGVPAFAGLPGTDLVEAERWQVVERRPLGQDSLLVMDRLACSPAS